MRNPVFWKNQVFGLQRNRQYACSTALYHVRLNTYTLEKGRQKAAGAVCAAFRRKGRRKRAK
ncbi:MAG: hypothetical protein F6K17_34570, partial [Okeania sp. SIO3C4]|nr:hypothetical protein [Okeania sp. SIO3C4]